MNMQKLKEKVANSKIPVEAIAKELGINPSTYYRKVAAQGDGFTLGQAKKLANMLSLTGAEAADIFLQ